MKNSVFLLFGIALMIAPRGAMAVIDPNPDTIGIYFDKTADNGGIYTTQNVPFYAYVILTNPSEAEIWGFEFGYTFTTSGDTSHFYRLSNELPPQSIDLGNNDDIMSGDYVVGMAAPLPGAPAVILVEWLFLLTTYMYLTLEMTASNTPSLPGDLPAYEAGGTIVPLGIGGGCYNGIAQIGSECPVSTEIQSFGSVKALYR